MIVRTAVMDELILRAVNRDGVEAVLNLAAGLDTHAYRLALPRALRWTDVDLPDMLSYNEEQLAGEQPSCALELAKVDLTDADVGIRPAGTDPTLAPYIRVTRGLCAPPSRR